MEETDLNDLLECAVDAVRTAGRHALANYARKEEFAQDEENDINHCG